MISVERCRELLQTGSSVSDVDLEALREQLYLLASAVCRVAAASQLSSGRLQAADADTLADIEERAAILQFDGGVPEQAAVAIAVTAVRPNRRK